MVIKTRGAFIPAYCSITTTANTAAAATRDPFDEDSYGAYTKTTNVVAKGITYTQADGKFTVAEAGVYYIECKPHVMLNTVDEVNLIINKNGGSIYTHDVMIHSSVDPVSRPFGIIYELAAGDFINFWINSLDGVDVVTCYGGTTANIMRIG